MTEPKPTVEDAYVAAHFLACDLVERINDRLQNLPAPGISGRPIHWGHVGDLNHINALLLEVVTFLEQRAK